MQLSTIKKANFSRTLLSDSAHALPPHVFKGACTDICSGRWGPWLKFLTNTDISLVCGGGLFHSNLSSNTRGQPSHPTEMMNTALRMQLLCYVLFLCLLFFFSWLGLALDWFEELLELAPEECSFHVEDLRTAGCKITFTFICVAPGGEEEDGSCPALLSEQVLGEG